MTATIEEVGHVTDADLEAFFSEYDRPCEAVRLKCPNVALYQAVWEPDLLDGAFDACTCGRMRQALCMSCKNYLLSPNSTAPLFQCRKCLGGLRLVRVESLI